MLETEVRICSIASGSNGNCYWIEHDGQAILVDVGINLKLLESRAKERQIDLSKVIAVFITHEHSDHVCGLYHFAKSHNFQTYMTAGTKRKCKSFYLPKPASQIQIIKADDTISVGSFTVHSFSKPHDVAEPCSFRVQVGDVSIGVFTDIGTNCEGLTNHLKECNAVFMESNYDEQMLRNGSYPQVLKDRISSDKGHLSNKQSAEIVKEVNPEKLHTIVLSHLSAENNTKEVAKQAFDELSSRYTILVATREAPSEIITILNGISIFSLK